MEKKRSVGIIIISILVIFLNLFLILIMNSVYERGKVAYGRVNNFFIIEYIVCLIFTSFFAIRLFFLKEYARKGLIIFMCIGILSDTIRVILRYSITNLISLIGALAIYLSITYYLTRPKVREQFN